MISESMRQVNRSTFGVFVSRAATRWNLLGVPCERHVNRVAAPNLCPPYPMSRRNVQNRKTALDTPAFRSSPTRSRASSFSFSSFTGCGGRIHGFRRRSRSDIPRNTSPHPRLIVSTYYIEDPIATQSFSLVRWLKQVRSSFLAVARNGDKCQSGSFAVLAV